MEQSAIIRECHNIEKELSLGDFTIKGIPIWRILRFSARIHYINNKVEYNESTSKPFTVGRRTLKLFSGFWRFLGRKNTTMVFPFGRLAFDDQQYFDKFTDPVLDISGFDNKAYFIVDSGYFQGNYKRLHKSNAISNEYRTVSRQILRHLLKLYFRICKNKVVVELYNTIKEPFQVTDEYLTIMNDKVAYFFADYYYNLFWFRLIKPKRAFIVYREGYLSVLAACKKLAIPVAEFQHGITLDDTTSYTGDYDSRIDPDYFLVFGNYWRGPQFGMPLERIIPVGWAYGNYIKTHFDMSAKQPKANVLVISSSEISEQILDALIILSPVLQEVQFHIRLHPSEAYDERLQQKLKTIPNAKVVNNRIDSAKVLPQYSRVIGENSSVLYEALSYGCKVGMLNICGLHPATYTPGIKDSFSIIDSKDDFERFMSEEEVKVNPNAFYTDFDANLFNAFIEEKM